jgi:hypothetical protein
MHAASLRSQVPWRQWSPSPQAGRPVPHAAPGGARAPHAPAAVQTSPAAQQAPPQIGPEHAATQEPFWSDCPGGQLLADGPPPPPPPPPQAAATTATMHPTHRNPPIVLALLASGSGERRARSAPPAARRGPSRSHGDRAGSGRDRAEIVCPSAELRSPRDAVEPRRQAGASR